jgi:hypothetical protein
MERKGCKRFATTTEAEIVENQSSFTLKMTNPL